MNYEALEGLVKSILSSFKCHNCESKADKSHLSVVGIENNLITLNVNCPSCGKISTIKSEILSVDLNNLNLPKEQIEKIRNGIMKNNSSQISKLKGKISDKHITDLNQNLKKDNLYVSDLFLDK